MTEVSQFNKEFFTFLSQSPTAFHACNTIKSILESSGFVELFENEEWNLQPGGGFFVQRDSGSIISFVLGEEESVSDGFRLIGGHTDSPGLQLKPKPVKNCKNAINIGVEVYGGPLLATWFDRDLSIAGRVFIEMENGKLAEFLIDFERPLITIPSLAIHLDREANKNRSINAQTDLPPLIGAFSNESTYEFTDIIASQIHKQYPDVPIQTILSFDLFCYDTQSPVYTGLNDEFILAGRLDNLISCFAAAKAMQTAGFKKNSMMLCYNHEENGSQSVSGAQSSFVQSVFDRICKNGEKKRICLANSFHISMDNAHATHPNALDKTDSEHPIEMNKGIVLKINANQSYASNAYSSSVFKMLCKRTGVNVQEFVMRSDMRSGSTIGSMTAAKLGIQTVDVGAPTLGMHSIREITGSNDVYDLYCLAQEFLKSSIHNKNV